MIIGNTVKITLVVIYCLLNDADSISPQPASSGRIMLNDEL